MLKYLKTVNMQKLKLKLEIDLSKSDQVSALGTLLNAIGGHVGGPAVVDLADGNVHGAAIVETAEEKPAKKKRRTKAEIKADEEKAAAEKADEEKADEEKADEEKAAADKEETPEGDDSSGPVDTPESDNGAPEFSRTDVRALFAEKIQGNPDNRESGIAKLKELGANNLPGLKEEHYVEFMAFLNTL